MGHLFQGRHKAILVDRDNYLLELVRYIHLNLVHARRGQRSAASPWSSHRAYLGKEKLSWLTTAWVLAQFAAQRSCARQRYASFIGAGTGTASRDDFDPAAQDGCTLGDNRFIDEILRKQGRAAPPSATLDDVIGRAGLVYGLDEAAFMAPRRGRQPAEARGLVAWLVRELAGASLTAAAERLKWDLSSLSAAATRLQRRARQDPRLAQRCQRLRNALQASMAVNTHLQSLTFGPSSPPLSSPRLPLASRARVVVLLPGRREEPSSWPSAAPWRI